MEVLRLLAFDPAEVGSRCEKGRNPACSLLRWSALPHKTREDTSEDNRATSRQQAEARSRGDTNRVQALADELHWLKPAR
jgi:hypothetical protein